MRTNPSTSNTDTTADTADDQGAKRGLFRRGRKSVEANTTGGDTIDSAAANADAATTGMPVGADEQSNADAPDAAVQRPNFDLASATQARNAAEIDATPETTTPSMPEAPVQSHTNDPTDIEARLDAVLSPTTMPATVVAPEAASEPGVDPAVAHAQQQIEQARMQAAEQVAPPVAAQPVMAQPVMAQPVMAQPVQPVQPEQMMQPAAQPAAHAQVAMPAATFAQSNALYGAAGAPMHETIEVSAAPTATRLLGLDVQRMVMLLEEEAQAAQGHIDLELRNAQARAEEVVVAAQQDAERIREHGQNQARVLLGEVEEIISEAQQTGEQILRRADAESGQLRQQAGAVLTQAQNEARSMIDASRREGEQVLAEQRRLATARAQEALREQERLKDQIRRLEERRRQVLESLEPLIDQLSQMMPTVETAAPRGQRNVVSIDRSRTINAGS